MPLTWSYCPQCRMETPRASVPAIGTSTNVLLFAAVLLQCLNCDRQTIAVPPGVVQTTEGQPPWKEPENAHDT